MSAEVITLTGMCGVACWELTSAPRRESARFLLPIASFYNRNIRAKIGDGQGLDE